MIVEKAKSMQMRSEWVTQEVKSSSIVKQINTPLPYNHT